MAVTSLITTGLLSARPAAGAVGQFFLATDTLQLFLDDGSAWQTITSDVSPKWQTTLFKPGTVADDTSWATLADVTDGGSTRILSAEAFLGTAPTGADGSNHHRIKIDDGVNTVYIPLDSNTRTDVAALPTESSEAQRSAGTLEASEGGYYCLRWPFKNGGSAFTFDIIDWTGYREVSNSGNAIKRLVVLSGDLSTILGQKDLQGTMSSAYDTVDRWVFDEPITIDANADFYVALINVDTAISAASVQYQSRTQNTGTYTTLVGTSTNGASRNASKNADPQLAQGSGGWVSLGSNADTKMNFLLTTYPTVTAPTVSIETVGTGPSTGGDDLNVVITFEEV